MHNICGPFKKIQQKRKFISIIKAGKNNIRNTKFGMDWIVGSCRRENPIYPVRFKFSKFKLYIRSHFEK